MRPSISRISEKIREDPFQAYELGYVFKGLRSYHLNHKGKSYRIVYEVFEEDGLIKMGAQPIDMDNISEWAQSLSTNVDKH